jgi:hypothetical protein
MICSCFSFKQTFMRTRGMGNYKVVRRSTRVILYYAHSHSPSLTLIKLPHTYVPMDLRFLRSCLPLIGKFDPNDKHSTSKSYAPRSGLNSAICVSYKIYGHTSSDLWMLTRLLIMRQLAFSKTSFMITYQATEIVPFFYWTELITFATDGTS